MIYIKISIILIIIVLAAYDVKYREIPTILVVAGILMGIILNMFMGLYNDVNFEFINILPAILFIVRHFVRPSEIGLGDGIVLLMSELSMSLMSGLVTLLWASIGVVVVSGVLVAFHRREAKIPFVLFIALGHLISFIKGY